ncbi:MAG: hypothetical protein AB1805_14970 [Nitrospirota bacterium]
MLKLSVDKLKPGMKVGKPVVNESGMILFGAGTVLTDVLIERLSNMSIGSILVEGTPKQEKTKEELLVELDARFSKTENEPYMKTLKQYFREHIEGTAS